MPLIVDIGQVYFLLHQREKMEVSIVEDYSRDTEEQGIHPALQTRQFHTIQSGVSKIVPEGH